MNQVSSDDGYVELSTPSGFNQLAAAIAKEGGITANLKGGKRRLAKKASKKASKKRSSRKQKGGSDLEGGKRRSAKKASKKASKKRSSRKQKGGSDLEGGKRRSAKKASKKASKKRSSRKQKGGSDLEGGKRRSVKKASKKRSSSKKSSSRKQKREMPEGAKAFNVFAMYVAKEMDMKFGAVVMKIAASYNNKVKEANPGITAVESSKKARALFDKDSKDARLKIAKEAERIMAANKAAKKAKKA